jgi:hypothetical protein
VMQQLADTRPVGIGSMGANAGGMSGRNPNVSADAPRGGGHHHVSDPSTFGFAVWQLKDGDDKIIADRLVEIFGAAAKA